MKGAYAEPIMMRLSGCFQLRPTRSGTHGRGVASPSTMICCAPTEPSDCKDPGCCMVACSRGESDQILSFTASESSR